MAGMTDVTWPMETVLNVRRLYVRAGATVEYVDQPGFLDEFGAHLADALVDEAHALGVEIHPGDVVVAEDELAYNPTTATKSYIARWAPSTLDVELSLPGAADGRVVAVRNVWDVLRLPVPGSTMIHTEPPSPSVPYLELEVCGWRETARRWVFRRR